jgi:hypothetical protein
MVLYQPNIDRQPTARPNCLNPSREPDKRNSSLTRFVL